MSNDEPDKIKAEMINEILTEDHGNHQKTSLMTHKQSLIKMHDIEEVEGFEKEESKQDKEMKWTCLTLFDIYIRHCNIEYSSKLDEHV